MEAIFIKIKIKWIEKNDFFRSKNIELIRVRHKPLEKYQRMI